MVIGLMFAACLTVASCTSTIFPVLATCLATIFPVRLAACATLHAQRNGVAGVQVHTGIHSSGPRGVGAVADRSRIERARRLMIRSGWLYRKCQLVHSTHACDFFGYVFGVCDGYESETCWRETVVTQSSSEQVPDPWLE